VDKTQDSRRRRQDEVGRGLVRHLRRFGPVKNVPVVIVSARKNAHLVGQRVGAAVVIPKPFDADVLVNSVASCLAGSARPN
jgi:DNA-binding response OmpR family regulator